MLDAVLGLPDQLRWAAGLDPPEVPRSAKALVAGMGGSGISGDFAAEVAAEGGRLVSVHKTYGLPGWTGSEQPLVVAVSYSGDTEEAVSAAVAAGKEGLPVAVVSGDGQLAEIAEDEGWSRIGVPGGLQPRAALGFLSGAVLRILEAAGVVRPQREPLEGAAALLDRLLGDGSGPAVGLADDLAEGLAGRVVVVYGAEGPSGVAARRWKTQINENAKAPAYWSLLPELDHNEVVGWTGLPQLARRVVGVVMLRDEADHPRVRVRFELTKELIADSVPVVGEVWAQGEGALSRMMSLALVGDLVSVALAEAAGIDPVAVEPIDHLKQRLASE